ncbi:hypothetical protein CASFOL_015286 [Castilleja foliolosa]|uniref:Uncharacterized protein n=1 Tax=Castilleja foliolosa TaxID=1961234 RepID=A0ABD3DD91_9LAMI
MNKNHSITPPGVVIESEIWEPNKALFIFLFVYLQSSFCPQSQSQMSLITRRQLLLFVFSASFSSSTLLPQVMMDGLWTVFGEYELAYFGFSKGEMLTFLSIGYAFSILTGSVLGVLSDLV